jgi:2-polyprenyl-3-methyl-5-hydroxy-6-metoxy-1,4-benzoquinol methylase
MFICNDSAKNSSALRDLDRRLEEYYNGKNSTEYYCAAQNANEEWLPTSSHGILLSLLNEGDAVLDLGCGTGVVAQQVKAKKIKYTGVDWSNTAIETALSTFRNKNGGAIDANFIRASIYETGLEDKSFDVVTSMFVIEHLTRPESFIEEAMRLVRAGGILFILCPDYRRFGRMPSLPLGGSNSLKEKITKLQVIPMLSHLTLALYWKIRTRFIGPWAVWTEPACFHGIWRPDADAVYLASRNEILKKITQNGFIDETSYWVSKSRTKQNKLDCLIVAKNK